MSAAEDEKIRANELEADAEGVWFGEPVKRPWARSEFTMPAREFNPELWWKENNRWA